MTGPTPGRGRRVVLLLNNPFVGDSRSWKLARSLAAEGWAVTVIARTAAGLPDREVGEGFTVLRIDQPRPLGWLPTPRLPAAATGSPDAEPRGWLGRAAAAVVDIVGRGLQAVRYLRLAGQWADRIRKVVPGAEIWQAEGLITLPVALGLRSRLGGRVVYDVRDLNVESSRFARLPRPWRRLLARRERAWARAADAVITANEPYAAILRETLGVEATVVHNGPLAAAGAPSGGAEATVSAGSDPIRTRLGLPPTTRLALDLGTVAPGRGIEQLCQAMTDVPDGELVIVGPGGAFRDELMAAAAGLPAAARIHFLPAVAPEEIPAWTAAADVAVMPIQPTTLNHRLTTPTRLFDALGAGVPVVASDLPGMAAIVRETGAGVLCDPTDPASIAAAIRSVLEASPERRAELRDAALAAARGPYAWDRQVARLSNVYRGLVGD